MKKGFFSIESMVKILFIVLVLFVILTAINSLYGQTFTDGIKKLFGEKTESEITHEKNVQVTKSFDNLKEQIEKCGSSKKIEVFDENKFINYPEFNSLGNLILTESRKQNIDPLRVAAFVKKESTFDQDGISSCGAVGLSQLMPDSAGESGLKVPQYNKIDVSNCNIAYECNSKTPEKCDKINDERFNPSKNIEGGIYYMKKKLEKNNDDFRFALAAFNAGDSANADSTYSGCIGKKLWECGKNKGYEQTRNHVEAVTGYYDEYMSIFYIKSKKNNDETCGCLINLKEFNSNYEIELTDKEIKLMNIKNQEDSGIQMASFDISLNCYWDDNFKEKKFEIIIFKENPEIIKEIEFWFDSSYKIKYKFNILKIKEKSCWLADNVNEEKIKNINECQ